MLANAFVRRQRVHYLYSPQRILAAVLLREEIRGCRESFLQAFWMVSTKGRRFLGKKSPQYPCGRKSQRADA